MGTDIRQIEDESVSVTKSVVDLDDDRTLVHLDVQTPSDETVRATVTDVIPETHTLGLGAEANASCTGGAVTVELSVGPHTDHEVGYTLVGPSDAALAEPRVERARAAATSAPTRTEWVGSDGTHRRLAVATDAVAAETSPVPMLADPETIAADALDGAAFGVILTPTNEDAVLRTVLRASRRGHTVFVSTWGVDESDDALDMLESLGALVVTPPSERASQLELHRLLSSAARQQGMAGIVLQTRDCPRIDYGRTADAFAEADYEVIAIPELWSHSPESPSVVVGIPAYNAADSIGEVVERAVPFAAEVVVVDDGSRDATAARAREAGASVVVHETNRGYGGALKTLFREAAEREATHFVVIDADGQHDPSDIPAIVETQERDDVDIVIGSRYVGERSTKIPFVRSLGLAVINSLTNASMGKLRPSGFIRDTQSGYRAYSLRAVRSLASDPGIGNNMGASTDILYHANRKRLSVAEVPTTISYDVENASSQGSLSHGMDLLRNIFWTVEYGRPLLILGVPGTLSTLLGVAVAVALLAQSVNSGVLAPVQLAVAVLFTLGGLLVCITSLMMSVLNGHPTIKRLGRQDNS